MCQASPVGRARRLQAVPTKLAGIAIGVIAAIPLAVILNAMLVRAQAR